MLISVNHPSYGGGGGGASVKALCDIRHSLDRSGVISLRIARKTEKDDKYQ